MKELCTCEKAQSKLSTNLNFINHENLSKDEMKKVLGGSEAPPPEGPCNGTDREAHCTWGGGACTNEAWGACPSGASNCDNYCVDSSGNSYWPNT